MNEGAADRFGTIYKNRSLIKERDFHHPDDFSRKTIAAKGWRALCQPPHTTAMSVVQEFYANLTSHVVKKVRVRGVLVDFSAESINSYYSLDHVHSKPFDRFYERPDYAEIIRVLTNGRGEWRLNTEGLAPNPGPTRLADPNRVRDARPCTGTPYLIFFFKSQPVPVGMAHIL